MAGKGTNFDEFIASEIKKYRGVSIPVKSGLLRRALMRKCSWKKMHPNPDDEFSMPEIGPNREIISRYEQQIRDVRAHAQHNFFSDRLIIQRMRPDGYMILNGHHRWAAAMRAGVATLPVKLVNLTGEKDIEKMLAQSSNTKRVTMDLDEVVLAGKGMPEKTLPFPFSTVYREKIRLGVPALTRFLTSAGYDVWIYTSEYYSTEYLQRLLKLNRVYVQGIITGTGRKIRGRKEDGERMDSLFAKHYTDTYHIDVRAVLHTSSGNRDFREFPLSGEPDRWSAEIMDIFGTFR